MKQEQAVSHWLTHLKSVEQLATVGTVVATLVAGYRADALAAGAAPQLAGFARAVVAVLPG